MKGMHEEHKRSALKTISWRVIGTLAAMFLVYMLTGQLELTASVGFFDIILRMPLYFTHERVWDRIAFGKTIGGTVESAMRMPPVTALPSETVSSVIRKMVSSEIGAIIVVEDKRPVGLITERDILERVEEAGRNPSETFAKEIMSSPVVTVECKKSLSGMLKIMRDKQIRRLAVTQNGELTGILTERRILESLL
ncbi:MAG: CBS domain-containing protein [Candidatus Bathyarchaeota archaeon]|nr:CBS domain-containing protein [Candidatus Bathyarchaeota archaeon]